MVFLPLGRRPQEAKSAATPVTDAVEKVFLGVTSEILKALDTFRAQRREGTTSCLRKTTTDLHIGTTEHRSGVAQKSPFARFLASFDSAR